MHQWKTKWNQGVDLEAQGSIHSDLSPGTAQRTTHCPCAPKAWKALLSSQVLPSKKLQKYKGDSTGTRTCVQNRLKRLKVASGSLPKPAPVRFHSPDYKIIDKSTFWPAASKGQAFHFPSGNNMELFHLMVHSTIQGHTKKSTRVLRKYGMLIITHTLCPVSAIFSKWSDSKYTIDNV